MQTGRGFKIGHILLIVQIQMHEFFEQLCIGGIEVDDRCVVLGVAQGYGADFFSQLAFFQTGHADHKTSIDQGAN